MATLLRRENITFRDQTIYMAGHAFANCTFDHCTIIVREATGVLENCALNNCVWHLDLFIGDRERFQSLVSNIGPILLNSLPSGAGAPTVNSGR
jgi:hypothetical protein